MSAVHILFLKYSRSADKTICPVPRVNRYKLLIILPLGFFNRYASTVHFEAGGSPVGSTDGCLVWSCVLILRIKRNKWRVFILALSSASLLLCRTQVFHCLKSHWLRGLWWSFTVLEGEEGFTDSELASLRPLWVRVLAISIQGCIGWPSAALPRREQPQCWWPCSDPLVRPTYPRKQGQQVFCVSRSTSWV